MAAVSKVFVARLTGLVVLGPDGESVGRVRDVVLTIRVGRQAPRVLGLVVELPTRKRIFVPMLRVTAIEPGSVTLVTGNVSLRRFTQRPSEVLALAQVLDSKVRVDDPELPDLIGVDTVVVDLGIELTRTRDWVVARVAVRRHRGRLARRAPIHIVEWPHVHGLTQQALSLPGQGVAQLLMQFEDMRPADVANSLRDLPAKRRTEVAVALDDERLADIVQELPSDDQTELLTELGVDRAVSVLEAMDPDDAADLLGELPETDAESFLQKFTPRTRRSPWSKRNREHVERLVAAGEMHSAGLAAVEAAKADGRWDRARRSEPHREQRRQRHSPRRDERRRDQHPRERDLRHHRRRRDAADLGRRRGRQRDGDPSALVHRDPLGLHQRLRRLRRDPSHAQHVLEGLTPP